VLMYGHRFGWMYPSSLKMAVESNGGMQVAVVV